MQTPSGTLSLDLEPPNQQSGLFKSQDLVQRNLRFDLREEGGHTLAINISYSETLISEDHASSGRLRSFRKLYQFTARPCLNVRTKVSPFADNAQKMALEAQIDNLADGHIVLKDVTFNPKPAFKSTSVNWDAFPVEAGEFSNCPILAPRDVYQVAFMIQEIDEFSPKKEMMRDGRTVLGQLGLRWRAEMGEEGFLTTGMLTTKRR